jgi:hypothetical protein
MRQLLLVIALATGMLSGAVWAQDNDLLQPIEIDLLQLSESDLLQPSEEYWVELVAERLERQARLDALMGTMTAEMAAVRQTKDRREREALMTTHREHMREAMGLMRGFGGERMREVMSQHAGSTTEHGVNADRPHDRLKRRGSSRPRSEVSDAERLTDLESRLDMMQIIIESLLGGYAAR